MSYIDPFNPMPREYHDQERRPWETDDNIRRGDKMAIATLLGILITAILIVAGFALIA